MDKAMDSELLLGAKFTVRADDQKLVLVKKPVEHIRHVVMKALLWALYLPRYPHLRVEVSIGYKYKPDLVASGANGPVFWAEAGHVGDQKLKRVLKRFPHTHFAFAVWGSPPDALEKRIQRQTRGVHRKAPIDLIGFPNDAASRFIDQCGRIRIDPNELSWQSAV